MNIISIILAGLLSVLPSWKPGTLDIHLISTGNGENTYVVMPDGTTMLIDAGQSLAKCINPEVTSAQLIADYVDHFSKDLPRKGCVDYFMLTHFHSDHMGRAEAALPGEHGYRLGGATALTEYFKIGKIVDRDYPNYSWPSKEYYEKNGNPRFMSDYIAWARYQVKERGALAERFDIGSHSQFAPLGGPVKGFDIWNLAGGAYVSTGHGKLTRPFSVEDPNLFDENMMSCALLFRYGPFSYYTGGDLPSSNFFIKKYENGLPVTEPIKANKNVEFRDFEGQVADLTGPVTAMKLSHHGCPDSSNPYVLWKMQPKLMFVFGSSDKQPSATTLHRIMDPQYNCAHSVYVTTERPKPSNGEELWSKAVVASGHILLRVTEGGKAYQVFVMDSGNQEYNVIYTSELYRTEIDKTTPDVHIEKADNFGAFDSRIDKIFSEVSAFAGTDELHSLMVLKDGKKVYERYDTGHDADEQHAFWSASKTFTAVAVGFAVQDGLLKVDDKVISFFPDEDLPEQRSEWLKQLTVKDLLIMASGLGTDGITHTRSLTWKNPAREVFAVPMKFKPGSKWEYNSMNTYLLSEIVQKLTGMKTSEYLNVKLFRPLGINHWEWEESADGVTAGGWGLYATTETLAKFGQFLLQKGMWNGSQLLNASWIEDLSSCQILQRDPEKLSAKEREEFARNESRQGYGYQVWRCTHNAYRVDGAHAQFSIVIPEKNAVIAVTAKLVKGKPNFMEKLWEIVYPVL